ncbi:MAG: TlpA family protein disulfide reductase [Burkholderiales bacterium]
MLTGGRAEEAALKAASFPDLQGKQRQLIEWRGRVMVLNFWASWCAPCREEIPLFIAIREKYRKNRIEIVGIAVDNRPNVVEYSTNMHISYPILLAGADGLDLMRKLGNAAGALPYTVIVGRKGGVEHRKLGAYKQAELDSVLQPMVEG